MDLIKVSTVISLYYPAIYELMKQKTETNNNAWEVVVAQLVEWSISIPEVRGSTPVIGKILLNICLLSTVLKRRK